VAPKQRQIERVDFAAGELAPVVAYMERLAAAGDGWINLVPRIADNDERPTSLGFFALFSGGGSGAVMCTWIPGHHGRRGDVESSLGITHVTGRRAVAELRSLGVPVPATWRVEQDHPRRGLVVRIPVAESYDVVLNWASRAVAALCAPHPIWRWRADVHLPAAS